MKATEQSAHEPDQEPRYDYEKALKLYKRHRESLPVRDRSWRYRFVIPVIAAVLVGIALYSLASNPHSYLWQMGISPTNMALGFSFPTLVIGLIVGHEVYLRRCVLLLRHAGIDVPERAPDLSLRGLWRDRKELRQHGLENQRKWFFLRFVLPHLAFVAMWGAMILLPDATFWEQPLGRQVVNTIFAWGTAAGYMFFVVELNYLIRIRKRVHLVENREVTDVQA